MPSPVVSSEAPRLVVPIDSTTGAPLNGALRDGTDPTRAAAVSADGSVGVEDRSLKDLLGETNRLLRGIGTLLAIQAGVEPFDAFLDN